MTGRAGSVDLTTQSAAGRMLIEGYGGGGFRIGGKRVDGSGLVFPERLLAWPVSRWEDVTPDSFDAVWAEIPKLEILLIGCGARHPMAPKSLRDRFADAGIGVDFMDTGAACRTFNVLLGENRQAAAALIAVD